MLFYKENNTKGKVPDSLIPNTSFLPTCTPQTSTAIRGDLSSLFTAAIGFCAFVTFIFILVFFPSYLVHLVYNVYMHTALFP